MTTTDVGKSTQVYKGFALHVPQTTLDGVATIAATRGLELGVRYSHGFYSDGNATAMGTTSLVSEIPTMGLGPEVRGTIRFDKSGDFALGFGGNVMAYRIPTGVWFEVHECTPGPDCVSTSEADSSGTTKYFRLGGVDNRGDLEPVTNAAALASYQFAGGRFGHVFAGVGHHTGFRNRFTFASPGSGVVLLVGGGYGIKVDHFRASIAVGHALTNSNSPIDYGLSGFFTLGLEIPLPTLPKKKLVSPAAVPVSP